MDTLFIGKLITENAEWTAGLLQLCGTLAGLPVRARHDAFHELIEERNRERCIAVTRALDHSLRYECLTYKPQGTDRFL
jgi:hypothetical protein